MDFTRSASRLGTPGARARLIVVLLSIATGAFAQDQGASTPAAPEQQEEIIVTGSRIARDVTDASTPLAIINAEEVKLSGTVNMDKVLSDQPQFVQATNGGATANTVPAGSA